MVRATFTIATFIARYRPLGRVFVISCVARRVSTLNAIKQSDTASDEPGSCLCSSSVFWCSHPSKRRLDWHRIANVSRSGRCASKGSISIRSFRETYQKTPAVYCRFQIAGVAVKRMILQSSSCRFQCLFRFFDQRRFPLFDQCIMVLTPKFELYFVDPRSSI